MLLMSGTASLNESADIVVSTLKPEDTHARTVLERSHQQGGRRGAEVAEPNARIQPERSYSVVCFLKKWAASGAATARMPTDQISAASTGCCIGHA